MPYERFRMTRAMAEIRDLLSLKGGIVCGFFALRKVQAHSAL
jgi:hypothetical protein